MSEARVLFFRIPLQDDICRVVPECVVDGFEIVDIPENHPQPKAMPRCPAQLLRRPFLNRPPLGQAGQRIGSRSFFQLPALGVQLPVQLANPPPHTYSCQHLAGIKRLR